MKVKNQKGEVKDFSESYTKAGKRRQSSINGLVKIVRSNKYLMDKKKMWSVNELIGLIKKVQ